MQVKMSIRGLMVDPITNMPIVILDDREGQRLLSISVGIFEAHAIALQIENISVPRPMTHDLLRNGYGSDAKGGTLKKIKRAACQIMKLGSNTRWVHTTYPTQFVA